jgi:hypothetical protein
MELLLYIIRLYDVLRGWGYEFQMLFSYFMLKLRKVHMFNSIN